MTTTFEIPVISVGRRNGSDDDRADLSRLLTDACHRVGFFVVTDHGVDTALVESVFEMMQTFFALDDSVKGLIDKHRSPHFRGWEPVGSEYTNNRVDVREQIDIWTEWPPATVGSLPPHLRLLGPNQWLPRTVLPEHRALTLTWMRELGELADDLLDLLAHGLGLPDSHFRRLFGQQPMSLTKMIHYPPTPPDQAGVNAHHDTGFLTVLAPGPMAGLQIENPEGGWVDVPSVTDAFVVNLGEMLQAMTGNYLVATPHRVIAHQDRLSTGYFHGPSLDTALELLPLSGEFADAVARSARHKSAGFMASADETDAGVGDMNSSQRPATYGEQLWNYFRRSYPDNVARHHPDVADQTED
jgi:isopenicillin N synthase-like dioxygenase